MKTDDAKIRKVVRFPNIANLTIGNCFLRVTLNTRLGRKRGRIANPVCISFYLKGTNKTLYEVLPYKMSEGDYLEMCRSTGKGRNALSENSPYAIKKQILKAFEETAKRLRVYAKHNQLTIDSVQSFLGARVEGTAYFDDFWRQFNETKPVGTKNAYEGARKSFLKHVGQINRTYLTAEDIRIWEQGMADAGISKTSVGMYLRACRAAWNEAVRKGRASKEDNPFGKIPQGASRKREWLDTSKMTELYDIFINKRYPKSWTDAMTVSVHWATGLFLFQYLANGCNLADVAKLKYNEDYFSAKGRILTFVRQKTEERSNMEVVIPVIEPLRKLMTELCSTPELGQYLFPNILRGETAAERIPKKVAQANKDVREGLRCLTDYLGWSMRPSGTWARHSFATNLTHAGVPDRYISEAMGHAEGGVTSKYIDLYPLAKQFEYNGKLLNLGEKEGKTITVTSEVYELFQEFLKQQSKPRQDDDLERQNLDKKP